ncbi:carboxypeptidase-like regulatory domain-containing protein [Gramella lutea]|uniref:Carboxypeptidase-like regulatory domain-containing protein n=1 Tax=Christiangramia lutea TaxID=1607951 RepID=A0A9X1V5M2_9FLAO|nr:carboxypeptidase-like regulatory domain-containing protein [Christiangramia lutea]MCH4824551.1 carboxypeptidase-like regulatory domain-containing protein [Christiangramia lutea]MCH4824578.1 carboxypeptidase-like regulatory domain-containing protein [Christiangramia lutea]
MKNRKSNTLKPINKSLDFNFFYLIIVITSLFSCTSTRPEFLSNLTIENKNQNRLIENRKPDYGIDGKDGCEVLGEISMNIIEIEPGFIKGKIFDSENKDPLINADIYLILSGEKKNDTLNIYSDQDGNFQKEFDGVIQEIEVRYIAFRNLNVNM